MIRNPKKLQPADRYNHRACRLNNQCSSTQSRHYYLTIPPCPVICRNSHYGGRVVRIFVFPLLHAYITVGGWYHNTTTIIAERISVRH